MSWQLWPTGQFHRRQQQRVSWVEQPLWIPLLLYIDNFSAEHLFGLPERWSKVGSGPQKPPGPETRRLGSRSCPVLTPGTKTRRRSCVPRDVAFHTLTILVNRIVREPFETKSHGPSFGKHSHKLVDGVLRSAQNDRGGAPVHHSLLNAEKFGRKCKSKGSRWWC